jgi:hypothetical protein
MTQIHTVSLLAASLLNVLLLGQANAQAPGKLPLPEDIRCVIVAMQISVTTDTNQRTGGNMLAMYYVGRLDKYPAKVIEDAIFKELPAMTPDLFKTEADRCGRILMEKGQVLTQIGNSISQRAKELQQKQSPAPSNAPATPAPEKPSDKQ